MELKNAAGLQMTKTKELRNNNLISDKAVNELSACGEGVPSELFKRVAVGPNKNNMTLKFTNLQSSCISVRHELINMFVQFSVWLCHIRLSSDPATDQ